MRGYGCKFKAGDVVGVLLNTADNSLYFFMQGAAFKDEGLGAQNRSCAGKRIARV